MMFTIYQTTTPIALPTDTQYQPHTDFDWQAAKHGLSWIEVLKYRFSSGGYGYRIVGDDGRAFGIWPSALCPLVPDKVWYHSVSEIPRQIIDFRSAEERARLGIEKIRSLAVSDTVLAGNTAPPGCDYLVSPEFMIRRAACSDSLIRRASARPIISRHPPTEQQVASTVDLQQFNESVTLAGFWDRCRRSGRRQLFVAEYCGDLRIFIDAHILRLLVSQRIDVSTARICKFQHAGVVLASFGDGDAYVADIANPVRELDHWQRVL